MNKNKVNIKNILVIAWGVFFLIGTIFFVLEKTKFLFVVDSDMLWHIKTGDWILANKAIPKHDVFSWHTGLNWIPHEWLYDVCLSIIYSLFGLKGIISVGAVLLVARVLFVSIYNVTVKKENIQGFSIFTACILLLIGYTWAVGRPLEFTMLVILTNLIIFIKKRKNWIYYLTFGISAVLTANIHGRCNLDYFCANSNNVYYRFCIFLER